MARRQQEEEIDLDEVDTFSANQEKILLDSAGKYGQAREYDDVSDEEVLALDEGNDLDVEDDQEEEDESAEEDEGASGWGGRKNYYGGDEASDDESSKQLSAEALKQQKKHLADLAIEDYIDEDWKKVAVTEVIPLDTVQVTKLENLNDQDRLDLLSKFPEFVPLLKEITSLQPKLETFQEGRVDETKKVALSAYLASIASYFAIFTDYLRQGETFSMKENPVMESILMSREVWRQVSQLGGKVQDVEVNELEVDQSGSELEVDEVDSENSDIEVDDNSDIEEDAEDSELDIDITKSRKIKSATKSSYNDYTESSLPDDIDLEEKQRRKKTLRFYTSKIDKASKRNGVASSQFSGDLDLPYQERLFERQQRLIEEARKRGVSKDGADLGGDDDDEFAEEAGENDIPEHENTEYDDLKSAKEAKKAARTEAHTLAVTAAKEGKLAELQESIGEDGKRAVSYQILKNKGLTPHRKKEHRNSRVKKRMQYDKAQKKLKSVRQVYVGDTGAYEGEKTGIKKGLSRSVKLV